MLFEDLLAAQKILMAVSAGYLLGSIPFAHLAARMRGVDIFSTGSRTAGTANVFWNIGRGTGVVVFVGDVAKGSVAVTIASFLDGSWLVGLLAGAAAVLGHWKPVLAHFRGGDGMATLVGTTLVLAPVLALMGITVGLFTLLFLWRFRLRSVWGLSVGFTAMLGLSLYYQVDRDLVLGLVALAALVLFHSLASRRNRGPVSVEGDEPEIVDTRDSDLGPAAPGNG